MKRLTGAWVLHFSHIKDALVDQCVQLQINSVEIMIIDWF